MISELKPPPSVLDISFFLKSVCFMNFPKKMKQEVIRIQTNFQMKPLHGYIKIVLLRSKTSIYIISECCPTITTFLLQEVGTLILINDPRSENSVDLNKETLKT